MAFTDHSDLFGSVHEDGFNRVVRHIMHQRPVLFNYATPIFHERPELFCEKIEAAEKVNEEGNPLFTEQEPLPILGTPMPIGINFCVQLTDVEIEFHPGNEIDLPRELAPLPAQRFVLRARACAGLDCPSRDLIEELLPEIERTVVEQQLLVIGDEEEETAGRRRAAARTSRLATGYGPGTRSMIYRNFRTGRLPLQPVVMTEVFNRRETIVLPTEELLCFCLELFAVGHFEWGSVAGSQQWLKPRLDGIEIVDLRPTPMENAIECYATTVLQLGILPRLMAPMEKMILDITEMLKEKGLEVAKQVDLKPATVPTDVPNNPAIEEDRLKAFIKLTVREGGA